MTWTVSKVENVEKTDEQILDEKSAHTILLRHKVIIPMKS